MPAATDLKHWRTSVERAEPLDGGIDDVGLLESG